VSSAYPIHRTLSAPAPASASAPAPAFTWSITAARIATSDVGCYERMVHGLITSIRQNAANCLPHVAVFAAQVFVSWVSGLTWKSRSSWKRNRDVSGWRSTAHTTTKTGYSDALAPSSLTCRQAGVTSSRSSFRNSMAEKNAHDGIGDRSSLSVSCSFFALGVVGTAPQT